MKFGEFIDRLRNLPIQEGLQFMGLGCYSEMDRQSQLFGCLIAKYNTLHHEDISALKNTNVC
jgi:hypothetical protein